MFGSLLLGLALAAPSPPQLVRHEGVWSTKGTAWRSIVPVDPAGGRVALTTPLSGPPGLSTGAHPVTAGGAVVAIDVDPGIATLTIETIQTREDGLFPPLIQSDAVQRVTIEGADWTADPRLGLEDRLTRTTQPGLTAADCGEGLGVRHPICLVVDSRIVDTGGLVGVLRPRAETSLGVMLVVAGLFVGVVGALIVCNQWLHKRGARERLEVYAREEFLR